MAFNETIIDERVEKAKKRAIKNKPSRTISILVDVCYDICHIVSYGGTELSLHPYQTTFARRVIESILLNDGARITALFSRQGGKTETVSFVATGLVIALPKLAQYNEIVELCPALKAFKQGFWVGIFAPVLDQAQTLFRRVRGKVTSKSAKNILNDPEINQAVETSNGAMVALTNGSIIECRSASPTANIESKTYHIAFLDEGQDIETTKMRKSISPMLAYTNGTMVMSGTCNTKKSGFFEQIMKNKQAMMYGNSRQNHFEYDYRTVEKYNPAYKSYIEGEKAAYGEDSDEFRMSYRLEWIFERGMFTSLDVLESKVLNPKYEIGEWNKFKNWVPIASLDFGKSQDSTVLTYGAALYNRPVNQGFEIYYYRAAVIGWLEISGDDWNTQYYRIMDALHSIPAISKLVADKTGVGAGIVDRLKASLSYVEIEEFDFNTSKSDAYKHLSQAISRGLIWMPYGKSTQQTKEFKRCKEQLTSLEKDWRGDKMVCNAPEGRNSHDDYPDSLAMFTWCAKTPPALEFDMSDYDPFSDKGPNELLRA
jgi:hypothetical protein